MGATHFLMKTLPKVRTEMSLHVLAYNLKRMIQMFGVPRLIAAMRCANLKIRMYCGAATERWRLKNRFRRGAEIKATEPTDTGELPET
jgi:hypothetical protein